MCSIVVHPWVAHLRMTVYKQMHSHLEPLPGFWPNLCHPFLIQVWSKWYSHLEPVLWMGASSVSFFSFNGATIFSPRPNDWNIIDLAIYSFLGSSADNLCKQFGLGLWIDVLSKSFDILIVTEKLILRKSQQTMTKAWNIAQHEKS